ncbi:MAG TPA: DNA polymerase Y family protein [Acetobacteraceae bacterium]|nr:DNA polymerase Y family protein [Acetobacteraceae bacterium]
MRRVVSVWLPFFLTDRLRRAGQVGQAGPASAPEAPFVTVRCEGGRCEGGRQVVAAVDRAARGCGVRPGMGLAEAEIRAPGLAAARADPAADEAALRRLAGWCLRYAPLAGVDPPDGLWIDAAGTAHLHEGGEAGMLADLRARLVRAGFAVRAAIADTPGAAHALARFGAAEVSVVPPGGAEAALAGLPPVALRLGEAEVRLLARLGIFCVAALAALPRGPLARRFGEAVGLRLAQALGRVAEPIAPLFPPAMPAARLAFAEPIATREALSEAIARLAEEVCRELARCGKGARRLDLLFMRVEGGIAAVRAGTTRAVRDARHLARLFVERLEEVDPGIGIEAMRLQVPLAEPLAPEQMRAALAGEGGEAPDLSALIDRLANRLGPGRVYRALPVESDVPERSVRRVGPLAALERDRRRLENRRRESREEIKNESGISERERTHPALGGKSWPGRLPRPARLLRRPEKVGAVALLPDHPPVQLVWRGRRRRLAAGEGPERIFGEWWRNDAETFTVRDYFRVEDEEGRRYWVFRRGDGADPATGDQAWFLHGFF